MSKWTLIKKLPPTRYLNNFSFEGNKIRAWRAFSVGTGRFLSYSQLEVVPQEETGLKVLKEWGSRSNNLGSVSHASSPRGEIFSASESTCVLTFKTREEAEAHMDAGKHVRASDLDCESVYDAARSGLTESEKCMWLAEIDSELHLKKPGLPVLENSVIKGGRLNQQQDGREGESLSCSEV